MIRPIRMLCLCTITSVSLASNAIAETDDQDKARIQMLEDQVVLLSSELRKLRQDTTEVQVQLSAIRATLKVMQEGEPKPEKPAAPTCGDRLKDAVEKRDLLMSMGLKESHPDLVNITGLMEKIRTQCGGTG